MTRLHAFRNIIIALIVSTTMIAVAIAVDPNAVAAARKGVNDAQTALAGATRDFAKARTAVASKFEDRPDWHDAFKAVNDAQQNLETVKQPVLDKLHATDEYVALAKERDDALLKMQALGQDPNASSSDYSEASKTRSDADAKMKRLDAGVLAADPGVLEAQKKLADAQEQTDALKKQVDEAVAADPACMDKKKIVDAAEQKLAEAKATLAAAVHPDTQPNHQP